MLYSSSSEKAFAKFTEEPDLFKHYHTGFESQAQQWPTNPVDECIKFLKSFNKLNNIGDFGCGIAKIAKAFGQDKKRTVHSFDLVDGGDTTITACNIAAVPLESGVLDCAISI